MRCHKRTNIWITNNQVKLKTTTKTNFSTSTNSLLELMKLFGHSLIYPKYCVRVHGRVRKHRILAVEFLSLAVLHTNVTKVEVFRQAEYGNEQ